MKLEIHSTPLQFQRIPSLPIRDFSLLLGGGETALPSPPGNQSIEGAVIGSTDVIRMYQQVIFELQVQVLRYESLLDNFRRSQEPVEEFMAEPSSPLNDASIQLVNSILHTRIPEESILRAFDDQED